MNKNYKEIIQTGLPRYKEWLNQIKNQNNAISLSAKEFNDIYCLFPNEIVKNVQVVKTNTFPYPPLKELNLPEIEYWNSIELDGITFNDLVFIKENTNISSTLFHECIHVSQTYYLGFDQQTIAYGLFTIYKNYDENPFEQMAYRFQTQFDQKILDNSFIEEIKKDSFESYNAAMELE
jgi:hypothetical protein